jgi:hypothetical protein
MVLAFESKKIWVSVEPPPKFTWISPEVTVIACALVNAKKAALAITLAHSERELRYDMILIQLFAELEPARRATP